jgi:hypothetical protein
MTWSLEGRRRPKIKWEREVERVMKQNLTPEDTVIWQLWRKATENQ